jgi:hypothetical protein
MRGLEAWITQEAWAMASLSNLQISKGFGVRQQASPAIALKPK